MAEGGLHGDRVIAGDDAHSGALSDADVPNLVMDLLSSIETPLEIPQDCNQSFYNFVCIT